MTDTDILIAGGGIAGMIAALTFAHAGRRVICVDPAPDLGKADLRSTAFLMPSVALLDRIGLFGSLRPDAAPLVTMRIVDAGVAPPRSVDFTAAEAGHAQFGWNIPNAALRVRLADAIAASPAISMLRGVGVRRFVPRLNDTVVSLSDGATARAALLVAADGRNSAVAAAAGIAVRRLHYGQRALVFTVRHETPHNGISTEVHQTGGPFTLVPLAGPDQTRSAVVWMAPGPQVARLEDMPDDAFADAVNGRAAGAVPPLVPDGPRASFPIIAQYATRLAGPRLALVAEAAHVLPPIGAQGLNTSLTDIAALADLTDGAEDPGAPAHLDQFARARLGDVRRRVLGIDALNRASMAGAPVLQRARARALQVLAGTPVLRRAAVAAGLGR